MPHAFCPIPKAVLEASIEERTATSTWAGKDDGQGGQSPRKTPKKEITLDPNFLRAEWKAVATAKDQSLAFLIN